VSPAGWGHTACHSSTATVETLLAGMARVWSHRGDALSTQKHPRLWAAGPAPSQGAQTCTDSYHRLMRQVTSENRASSPKSPRQLKNTTRAFMREQGLCRERTVNLQLLPVEEELTDRLHWLQHNVLMTAENVCFGADLQVCVIVGIFALVYPSPVLSQTGVCLSALMLHRRCWSFSLNPGISCGRSLGS